MKLDGKTIQTAIVQLIDEYKFDPHQILDIVKMGVKSAFRKDYLDGEKKIAIQVSIDKDGNIKILREYSIVETVEDEHRELTPKQAKEYKDGTNVGENIFVDITPEQLEFSRIAVQAAAQTIKQNLKKIERERFFEKFQNKQGELLSCRVLKIIGDNVILDIEGTTVILPPEGQIPNRLYNVGEEVIVLLKQISKGAGGIVLDITQSSDDFVEAVLENQVPEVVEGKVKIENIARAPGKRSKVMVSSEDERIDPVGVFVGTYGDRITNIINLLDGEKIDFIEYSEDPKLILSQALKPAKIKSIDISGKNAYVNVDDDQKALAIGRGAINIKLAKKLTGYNINIE